MNVELTWATPNAEELIVKMARVSAPKQSRQHGYSTTLTQVSD
jgi:hypothetical protein